MEIKSIYIESETEGSLNAFDVRIIAYRRGQNHPDGASMKAAFDSIVRGGLFPDDAYNEIKKITLESVLITKNEDERIIIEIYQSD